MSMFREALRAMLLKNLRCPRCPAENRSGASDAIDVDQTSSRAYCTSCSYEAAIEQFQPDTPKEN